MLKIEPVLNTSSTIAAIQLTVETAALAYGIACNSTKITTSHNAITKPHAHSLSRAYIASMRLDRSDADGVRVDVSDDMNQPPPHDTGGAKSRASGLFAYSAPAPDPCSLSGIFHSFKDMPNPGHPQQETCRGAGQEPVR